MKKQTYITPAMEVVRVQPCNLLSVSDSITDNTSDKVIEGFGGGDNKTEYGEDDYR